MATSLKESYASLQVPLTNLIHSSHKLFAKLKYRIKT